jgi:hydroxyacylglutathione hydrolase
LINIKEARVLFRQFLNEDLSCASYVIGSAGEAFVVDPALHVDPYLELAAARGLRIVGVLETHVHADHVSGRGLLVAETGATAYLPVGSEPRFQHRVLRDGDVLSLGGVEVEVLATPGHRPEHVAYLVRDRGQRGQPRLVLTGDSLLVGDVARPDLAVDGLEQVIGAARDLRRSIGRLFELPDYVEVWPGHIGGSLCGGTRLSDGISSTIGYERRANAQLFLDDEEAFVRSIILRTPDRPPTVETVVERNRSLSPGSSGPLPSLAVDEVAGLIAAGATLIDGRSLAASDAAGIPGAVSIPAAEPGAGTRAAWFCRPGQVVLVTADDDAAAAALAAGLAAVGLTVRGSLRGGVDAWRAAGFLTAEIRAVDAETLAGLLWDDSVVLVDVRDDDERRARHVPGSIHVPWREIGSRYEEAAADGRPVVVACATGRRAAVAASVLRRSGGPRVLRLAGAGIADLAEYGIHLAGSDAAAPRPATAGAPS